MNKGINVFTAVLAAGAVMVSLLTRDWSAAIYAFCWLLSRLHILVLEAK